MALDLSFIIPQGLVPTGEAGNITITVVDINGAVVSTGAVTITELTALSLPGAYNVKIAAVPEATGKQVLVVWSATLQMVVSIAELLRASVIEAYTDTLETAVAAVQTTANTIEGHTDTLETAVAAVQTTANTIEGYTDTLESTLATIQSTLAAIQAKTDTIVSPFTTFLVTDTTPTASSFKGDSALHPSDDRYNQRWLVFLTGNLAGEARKVSDYVGLTRQFSFTGAAGALDAPFPLPPENGDIGILIGRAG